MVPAAAARHKHDARPHTITSSGANAALILTVSFGISIWGDPGRGWGKQAGKAGGKGVENEMQLHQESLAAQYRDFVESEFIMVGCGGALRAVCMRWFVLFCSIVSKP